MGHEKKIALLEKRKREALAEARRSYDFWNDPNEPLHRFAKDALKSMDTIRDHYDQQIASLVEAPTFSDFKLAPCGSSDSVMGMVHLGHGYVAKVVVTETLPELHEKKIYQLIITHDDYVVSTTLTFCEKEVDFALSFAVLEEVTGDRA